MGAGLKDFQPMRLQQAHANDVVIFIMRAEVLKKDALELKAKLIVDVQVAHIDIVGMNIDFVHPQNQKRMIKKEKNGAFADAFAPESSIAH